MQLHKMMFKLMVWLTTCCFVVSCYKANAVLVTPGNSISLDKKFAVIHWLNYTSELTQAYISDNVLKGVAAPKKHHFKGQTIHFYIDKSIELPIDKKFISIPVTEFYKVEMYTDRSGNIAKTVFFTLLGAALITAAVIASSIESKESSCPFVYAFNGEVFGLEGEIYSGAIYPSLERHDYLPLPHLQAAGDAYHIKLTNEVKEIQYTNLAELIVVDHQPGSEVLFDKYGSLYTFGKLSSPQQAQSLHGDDISAFILNKDSLIYAGDLKAQGEALMDGMIVHFREPAHTDTAKLIIRAKNSFWFDHAFGLFSNQFGEFYPTWREMQKAVPAEQLQKWSLDQGMPLSVYIEKDQQWQFVDYFNLAGPMALRSDLLAINVADIASDEVKIKLEYGFAFWEVDYVGMDFSKNLPVLQKSVPLSSAIDHGGKNVSELLMQDDSEYQVLAEVGQQVTLKFPAPERLQGMQRTVFLHSKGHYEAIRDPKGKPDFAHLIEFRQPGRFIEFSNEKIHEFLSSEGDKNGAN